MLRATLLAIGTVLLLGAAACAAFGYHPFLPHLLVPGLLLTAGVIWERWHYKRPRAGRPDPNWQATGERFVDPESGKLVEVYYDPRNGARHYLQASG